MAQFVKLPSKNGEAGYINLDHIVCWRYDAKCNKTLIDTSDHECVVYSGDMTPYLLGEKVLA